MGAKKNQNVKMLKITNGTKNVRNRHIPYTLPILYFFELKNKK